MLQKIFFLTFSAFICLPLKTSGQQDRNVIWLHGLNGQSTDWLGFRNQFNSTYRMNGFQPSTYNSSDGIQQYSNGISFWNSGRFTNNLITIGHSMGGVAARHMDVNSQANLGGLITVGSPLDGAGIASSLSNNSAATAVQLGIENAAKGPIAQLLPIPVLNNIIITVAIDKLRSNGVLNLSPSAFGTGAVNDLKLGGGVTADMNANPTSLPKVSIYGNEESPVHWNIATTAARQSGLNIDLVDIADQADDIYYAFYVVDLTEGIAATVFGFWNPWLWLYAALKFWQADQWKQGYDWFVDSERIWNVLIGANIVVGQCYTYQAYICYYPSTSSSCWQTRTSCFTSQLNGQSDGFIPANSQAGVSSASWLGVPAVEALGVNHLEEIDANNAVMQGSFAEIFSGIRGTYFQTSQR